MKIISNIFSSIIISFIFLTSVHADDADPLFYEWRIGPFWNIRGHLGGEHASRLGSQLNPSCVLLQELSDGSDFQLIQDLKIGELYISAANPLWKFPQDDLKHNVTIGFYTADGNLNYLVNAKYKVVNTSVLYIENLDIQPFIEKFAENDVLVIVPTEQRYEPFRVNLKNSREGVGAMLTCLKKYQNNRDN